MALTAEEQALASSPLQFNFAHMYCTLISIFNFNQDKILVTSDLYFWNLQVNSFPTRYHTS